MERIIYLITVLLIVWVVSGVLTIISRIQQIFQVMRLRELEGVLEDQIQMKIVAGIGEKEKENDE